MTTNGTMRPTRLRVTNFRGVKALDETIGARGALFVGENGEGKTSAINAVRAALDARDIHPDAIRHGAKEAEILVDFEHASVRRVIRQDTRSTVRVTVDGIAVERPQTWLDQMFGGIDALAFYGAKEPERRAMLLAALPVTVTLEQLRAWAPDLPDGDDVSTEHGLEVLERVRASYYAQRTEANAAAKASRAIADRLRAALPSGPAPVCTRTVEGATAEVDKAHADLASAKARRQAAVEHMRRTSGMRERIAQHRATAGTERPGQGELEARAEEVSDAECRVRELEVQLTGARVTLDSARRRLGQTQGRHKVADEEDRKAGDLEAMLDAAAPESPTDEELDEAGQSVAGAEAVLHVAQDIERRERALRELDAAEDKAKLDAESAESLDGVVRALTDEAPAALLAAANAIPGLALDGDDIALDGVRLGGLCGAEAMYFAVDVARRLNAKTRILVVDGLERLDPEQLEQFVRHATRDGYQLSCRRLRRPTR